MRYMTNKTTHEAVCAYKASVVLNTMIQEGRHATEDELIECYTFLTEGINAFSFEELLCEIKKWFLGVFLSRVESVETELRRYLKADIINDLMRVENEVFYHNELFSIRHIATS